MAGGGAFPNVGRARVLWAGLDLDEHGRNTVLWPRSTFAFRSLLSSFDAAAYEVTAAPADQPEPIAPTTMAGRQRAVPTIRQTEPAQASRQTFWQAHVQAWRISGLPRAAYCQQQNLSPRAFNAAVARLRQTFRPDPKTASKSA